MVRGFPWARWLFGVAVTVAVAAGASVALGHTLPGWVPALCGAAILVAVGAGVFRLDAGLFARPLSAVRGDTVTGRVALTFDDGPDRQHTAEVLTLLDSRGHRGTFFVIGRRAE